MNVYSDAELGEVLEEIVARPVVEHLRRKVADGEYVNLRKATADLLISGWSAEVAHTIGRSRT